MCLFLISSTAASISACTPIPKTSYVIQPVSITNGGVYRVAKVTKKDKKAVKAGINGVDSKLQAFQGAAIREACHCLEKQPVSRYKRRRTAQLMKVLESDFDECGDRLFHVISEFLKTNEGNLYSKCLAVQN